MGASDKLFRLYERLPIPLQNLMVTVQGARLRRRRYGPEHDRVLAELMDAMRWDRETIERHRLESIQELLRYAQEQVPHYRDLWRQIGFDARDVQTLDDFRQLPPTEKDELREDPLRFVAESRRGRGLIAGKTSGTTGKALVTYKEQQTYQKVWAFQDRQRRLWGIDGKGPWASIRFPVVVPKKQTRAPFWRQDYLGKQTLFSCFHLAKQNLDAYLEKLAEIQPEEINGYPSAIYPVALHALKRGFRGVRPKAVITVSEKVLEAHREVIEEAFACKVADQYGAAECVFWVAQCPELTWHVAPEFGHIEALRGAENVYGLEGDAVGTSFVNRVQVLIRYRLGDSVVLDETPRRCACGWPTDTMANVVGRIDDTLYSYAGTPLSRLDIVFKALRGIREAQIVQRARDHVVLRVVRGGEAFERDCADAVAQIQALFGPEVRVETEACEAIPRSATGKFRAQLNLTGSP